MLLQVVTSRAYSVCNPIKVSISRYIFETYQQLQQGYQHFLWKARIPLKLRYILLIIHIKAYYW